MDIVAENPDKFRVVALAAGSNVTLLADQVNLPCGITTFHPFSNLQSKINMHLVVVLTGCKLLSNLTGEKVQTKAGCCEK